MGSNKLITEELATIESRMDQVKSRMDEMLNEIKTSHEYLDLELELNNLKLKSEIFSAELLVNELISSEYDIHTCKCDDEVELITLGEYTEESGYGDIWTFNGRIYAMGEDYCIIGSQGDGFALYTKDFINYRIDEGLYINKIESNHTPCDIIVVNKKEILSRLNNYSKLKSIVGMDIDRFVKVPKAPYLNRDKDIYFISNDEEEVTKVAILR